MKEKQTMDLPSAQQLAAELRRQNHKKEYGRILRSTIYTLIVVAAIAVLVATMWIPVFRIYGTSMTPTITEGEIVVALKGSSFENGDVVALWYNNKLLVKRIIAGPGEWVNIDSEGNVYVDKKKLEEPYVSEKAFGDCNIQLPYQVGDDRYFVMGDHRGTSQDSRNTAVGCIPADQIVGRIVFRVWPFNSIGRIG